MRHVLPLYHVYHVSGTRADAVVFFSRRCAGDSPPTRCSKFPLSDLVEVEKDAYTQWLERWVRESVPALGAAAAHALAPAAVPPAGRPPTPPSGTDLPPPSEDLYWEVLEGPPHHVGQIVQSESVCYGDDGDDGNVTLRMPIKDSGIGAMVPTQLYVFQRSAVELRSLAAFIAFKKEKGKEETEKSDSGTGPPKEAKNSDSGPENPASAAKNTAGVDDIADHNDSATAALNKYVTYANAKEQTGMGNDKEDRRTTLRVRDFCSPFFSPCHVSAPPVS